MVKLFLFYKIHGFVFISQYNRNYIINNKMNKSALILFQGFVTLKKESVAKSLEVHDIVECNL